MTAEKWAHCSVDRLAAWSEPVMAGRKAGCLVACLVAYSAECLGMCLGAWRAAQKECWWVVHSEHWWALCLVGSTGSWMAVPWASSSGPPKVAWTAETWDEPLVDAKAYQWAAQMVACSVAL